MNCVVVFECVGHSCGCNCLRLSGERARRSQRRVGKGGLFFLEGVDWGEGLCFGALGFTCSVRAEVDSVCCWIVLNIGWEVYILCLLTP